MATGLYDGVNGVARKVAKKYDGVNAVARKTKSAYDGVNNVARQYWKSGKFVGGLAVGDSVYMKVNGVSKEFIIVHQSLPSSVYDSSCDGTWLLMKDIYESRTFDSTDNDYENSDIHSYLNNTFVNLFDSGIRSVIKQVKLPYTKGTGSGGSLTTGSTGISAKVFLLSYTELGFSGNTANKEGATLDYFNGASNSERIAYLNGTAYIWWLRTPVTGTTKYEWCIRAHGGAGDNGLGIANTYGIRPALILPSDTGIDSNYNIVA